MMPDLPNFEASGVPVARSPDAVTADPNSPIAVMARVAENGERQRLALQLANRSGAPGARRGRQ